MRSAAPALAFLLLVAACGATGGAGAHPSPSPTASASAAPASPSPAGSPAPGGLLFAVLETARASTFPANANTVAIVGLDGYARSKQHFTARTVPGQCNAASIPQPEARVAGGKVYYADGAGVVRSLDPSGAVAKVITFAITGQQLLSFALDPTGGQVLGSVITIPKFGAGLPCQQSGSYVVDLEYGPAGGNPQNVYHQAYAQIDQSTNFVEAVGWDQAGALVTVHSVIGTQAGTYGRTWWGQLAHWTPQGIGAVVGGSDCQAQDEQANSIVCISANGGGVLNVRGPDGTDQWAVPGSFYYFGLLSPDATQVAWCSSSGCGVTGRDGSTAKLSNFAPTGWLNDATLIGTKGSTPKDGYGELETISLSDLTKVNDLGFTGMFVGVVQGS